MVLPENIEQFGQRQSQNQDQFELQPLGADLAQSWSSKTSLEEDDMISGCMDMIMIMWGYDMDMIIIMLGYDMDMIYDHVRIWALEPEVDHTRYPYGNEDIWDMNIDNLCIYIRGPGASIEHLK